MEMKFKNLKGERFGRLIAIDYVGKNKSKNSMWVCKCDCGNITKPIINSSLIKGRTKSCGCLEKENLNNIQKEKKLYNKTEIILDIVKVFFNNKSEYFICDFNTWKNNKVNSICWVKNDRGYVIGRNIIDGKNVLFHRYIFNGLCDNLVVDHINGNTLDNRICNLRKISQMENTWNHNITKNTKYGISGIQKENNKFEVYITRNRDRIRIGRFDNLKDAIEAREKAELKYYDKFSAILSRHGNYEPVSLDEIIGGYK